MVEEDMSEIDLITHFEPDSFLAESYRKISVNLSNLFSDDTGHTLILSSVLPGDGTTTTAANLAVTLAQNGRKTILLDCNFRNPTQHLIFSRITKQRIMVGLGEYLTGKQSIEQLIQPTGIDGLEFVPNGLAVHNPAHFFGTENMHMLLDCLQKKYEFILLDLPAVLPVADTLALTEAADGILLTMSAGRVAPKVAKVAVDRLEKAGGKMLGVILNKISQSRDSGYKDYEYYRRL